MITIHRKTLERLGACPDWLALYDQIADGADCIVINEWTPLHSLWPYVAGHGAFARWLEARGIIPHANLSGVDLSGANLSGVDLSCVNLHGANLSGANLSRGDLHGADLSGANLQGADLSGAYLAVSDLSGADLSGADLSGANLSGAYRGSSSPIPGWCTNEFGFLK